MKFKEGTSVEVLRRKEEQFDSWFPAKILVAHCSAYTVRFKLLATSYGKPVVELVQEEDVRPCPPLLSRKVRWTAGDVAEVLDLYAWRVGNVVKLLKNDRVVIKLCGSMQLKEYFVSDLRVLQAWQDDQWTMTGMRCGGKKLGSEILYMSSKHARKLDDGANQGIKLKQSPARHQPKEKNGCCYTEIMKRNLDPHCGFSPVDIVRTMDQKRKASAEIPHRSTKKAPHAKVGALASSKNIITDNSLHKDIRATTDRDCTYYPVTNLSSVPLLHMEDNSECSVASCSANDEHPGYGNQNLRKHSKDTTEFNSFGQAMLFNPLEGSGKEYQSRSGDEIAANVHKLELQAYQSTIQALHASGPLSWEQESLLTNLRLSLNISNEEHLLHLKQLLSA